MASVETSNDGSFDAAALLRKVSILEGTVDKKANASEVKELRDSI
jgi:hypothetical protein